MESSNKLADQIDCIDKFEITWTVSFDNAASWKTAGKSDNLMYVTWADPQGDKIYTMYDVGCRAAKGQGGVVGINDDAVLDKVWTKFKTLKIRRVSDNKMLTYYGFVDKNNNDIYDKGIDENVNSTDATKVYTAAGLVKLGNGQCAAWVYFFSEVLSAQGLIKINKNTKEMLIVTPIMSNLAIKNWAPPKEGSTNPRKIPKGYDDAEVDGKNPKKPNDDEVADEKGVNGQGNSPNPPALFSKHYIFKVNGEIYDPSYALGPFKNNEDYEASAFEGKTRFENSDGKSIQVLYDSRLPYPAGINKRISNINVDKILN
jgi:hypothetical protein